MIHNYNFKIKNPTCGELIEHNLCIKKRISKKILSLDSSIKAMPRLNLVSNILYLLFFESNIEKLNNN